MLINMPSTHLPIIFLLDSNVMKFLNNKNKFFVPKNYLVSDLIKILKNVLDYLTENDILELKVNNVLAGKVNCVKLNNEELLLDIYNEYMDKEFGVLILNLNRKTLTRSIYDYLWGK